MRAGLGWSRQVFCWLVILGVVAVLTVAVLVPRLGGATPYAVLTGSMQPTYPPGTLVVAQPVAFDGIAIGDVITYQLRSGEPTVVTHRVIGRKTQPDGASVLLTQGDANDIADTGHVREEQVRGRLWYAVPHLGRLNSALTGREQQVAVYGVAAALLIYAGAVLLSGPRDRRRRAVSHRAAPGARHAAPVGKHAARDDRERVPA